MLFVLLLLLLTKVSISTDVVFSSLCPIVCLLNSAWYIAAAAINVSTSTYLLRLYKTFYSPVSLKLCIKCHASLYSHCVCVTSIVGRLSLALAKMLPRSVRLISGETKVETPPSLSDSARFRQMRNSYKVSPPSIEPRNKPSGSNVWLKFCKVDKRSLTQCMLILLTIRSNSPSLNSLAQSFSSSRTLGMICVGWLTWRRSHRPDSSLWVITS